jgi:hypothetical protein
LPARSARAFVRQSARSSELVFRSDERTVAGPLEPGVPAEVVVLEPGYAVFRRAIPAAEPGEIVEVAAELDALDAAELHLELRGAPRSEFFDFELSHAEDPSAHAVWSGTQSSRDERFVLSGLVPGAYRLRVFPGGRRYPGRFLDEELALELEPGTARRETVTLRPGGSVELAFVRRRPAHVRATLVDALGEPLDADWTQPATSQDVPNGGLVPTAVSSLLLRAVPPGSYRLLLEADGRAWARDVPVAAGETTYVTVDPREDG